MYVSNNRLQNRSAACMFTHRAFLSFMYICVVDFILLVRHHCPWTQISCPLLSSSVSSWCGHVVLVCCWSICRAYLGCTYCLFNCLEVPFLPCFWVNVELGHVHFSNNPNVVYCYVCVIQRFLLNGNVLVSNVILLFIIYMCGVLLCALFAILFILFCSLFSMSSATPVMSTLFCSSSWFSVGL